MVKLRFSRRNYIKRRDVEKGRTKWEMWGATDVHEYRMKMATMFTTNEDFALDPNLNNKDIGSVACKFAGHDNIIAGWLVGVPRKMITVGERVADGLSIDWRTVDWEKDSDGSDTDSEWEYRARNKNLCNGLINGGHLGDTCHVMLFDAVEEWRGERHHKKAKAAKRENETVREAWERLYPDD